MSSQTSPLMYQGLCTGDISISSGSHTRVTHTRVTHTRVTHTQVTHTGHTHTGHTHTGHTAETEMCFHVHSQHKRFQLSGRRLRRSGITGPELTTLDGGFPLNSHEKDTRIQT
ncbi:unnamed protein product [Leuciscus chuanchicus]